MKNLTKSFLCAGLAGGIAVSASGQEMYVSEDFQSIADWSLSTGGSHDTEFGNPEPSGAHDGSGSTHLWDGDAFSITPTDDLFIVLTADIYHTGVGNQRNTVGLRGGPFPLFEMGHYNAFNIHADPEEDAGSGMGVRINSFAGHESGGSHAGDDWVQLASNSEGWNTWEATFTETDVSIRLDVGGDGNWDVEWTSEGVNPTGAFSDLRFGGPSNLTSAGGGFNVDNITLETVPEPSTYAAIFGGLALIGAFVWRRRRS